MVAIGVVSDINARGWEISVRLLLRRVVSESSDDGTESEKASVDVFAFLCAFFIRGRPL